ncbi:hypothetical protein KIW84_032773 [Lathyrus oleraceus]|uniref:PB1-like domain-containing protein n=1 Tax=Pisum sativum TaxID=3888 RepID=A0A9D5B267_PEA|nr:hypothetical protein KIW84_032773 [Pisum sativum]
MDNSFECVVHHEGEFSEFTKLGYQGLKEVWKCDHDYRSYFEVFSGLKELGYPIVESLWHHDAIEINEIIPLKDDMGENRMKIVAMVNGKVHLYILHPLSQPDIIEKSVLSLEYNIMEPNEKEEYVVALENEKLNQRLDEGLDLNLELDERLSCNKEEMEQLYYNKDGEDGFKFNEIVHEGLECNLQKDEGMDYNQETGGANEDNVLEVNFEDSEDDIGIDEEISVEIDEVLEEEMMEGQGK